MTIGVIAAVLSIMAVLYAIVWLFDRALDWGLKDQPARVRPPRACEIGRPLDEAADYTTPRCARSTALAAAHIPSVDRSRP